MKAAMPKLARWLAVVAMAASLTASLIGCGGGGGGGDEVVAPGTPVTPPPPPPPVNAVPVAAFAALSSVVAGLPLPLDASASRDADNDVLTYSWNLGNGQRGGGQKIAAVFDTAGSYTVRLTVDDGRGGVHSVEQAVLVGAGPAAAGAVGTAVVVRDTSGAPLSGVTVSVQRAGGASASTGADGRATLSTERGIAVTLKISRPGYADQFKTQTLPAAAESGYLPVTLLAREPALTLVSAAAGGELVGKDGVKVVFAPNTLVDAAGNAVSGPVQVAMTPVDVVAHLRAFPGRFEGVRPSGRQGLLLSHGTVEFVLSAGGAPVQLASGKKATIEIPIYAALKRDGTPIVAGDTFPIWSLNERTGGWTEEGVGTVVAAASPSDLALRAEVTHFTWWNHDDFDGDPGRPKPKCQTDTNLDGIPEDLSGTGYCWHEAVPELADFAPGTTERITALASPARNRARAEPRTRRIPAFAATAATPVGGGVALDIPSDLNVVFRSWALNGTLFGSKVVRAAAGVSEDVSIVLSPVKEANGLNRIGLPYDDRFVVQTTGEVDRFFFTPAAGASYQVRVSGTGGSTLQGDVRVTQGDGAALAVGAFGGSDASPFDQLVRSPGGEDVVIAVTAGAGAPGAYRIEVVALGNSDCTGTEAVTLPMSPRNLVIASNSKLCFSVTLAAEDALLVEGSARGVDGTFSTTLNNATADVLGSKSQALSQANVPFTLRAAVAQAGSYRVELINRGGSANAVIQGFALLTFALDGVLDVPGQRVIERPAGLNRSYWYIARPAAPGAALAVTLDDLTSEHGFKVWPSEGWANKTTTGRPVGRVVRAPAALHPLIQVYPTNSTRIGNITLGLGTPLALASDANVATTVPAAGAVQVYAFDADVGEELSLGFRDADGLRAPSLFAPTFGGALAATGPGVGSFPGIFTVAEAGRHTLEINAGVGNAGSVSGAPYTFRLNRLPAAEPVLLGTGFERSDTLALGQIKRYAFGVTPGQLIGFELSSPTALEAALRLVGGDVYLRSGYAELAGAAPRALATGPRYVQSAGSATLQVYAQTVGAQDSQRGAFALKVSAPTPAPAELGARLNTALQANRFVAYRFDIATAGRHLLCYQHAGEIRRPGFERHVETVVWGPSATMPAYEGDIQPDSSNRTDFVDALRSGPHTLTLFTRLPAIDVTARLLRLPEPADITVGAAPTQASLAPCEVREHRTTATVGQAYTLTVTAAFAGRVQVRKVGADGQAAAAINVLRCGVSTVQPRVVSFTIPTGASFGTGLYTVEIDGDGEAAGAYTLSLTSP